jgi:hypothetical protein
VIKQTLLSKVLESMARELDTLSRAADEARLSATHPEAKQENKYDTRGLEASYLAHGQSLRASIVLAGTLIEVQDERLDTSLKVFLLPKVGGLKIENDGTVYQVLSTASPLGKELLGRNAGDSFEFKNHTYEIRDVL